MMKASRHIAPKSMGKTAVVKAGGKKPHLETRDTNAKHPLQTKRGLSIAASNSIQAGEDHLDEASQTPD